PADAQHHPIAGSLHQSRPEQPRSSSDKLTDLSSVGTSTFRDRARRPPPSSRPMSHAHSRHPSSIRRKTAERSVPRASTLPDNGNSERLSGSKTLPRYHVLTPDNCRHLACTTDSGQTTGRPSGHASRRPTPSRRTRYPRRVSPPR